MNFVAPAKKKYVASSVAESIAIDDGILKFLRQVLSDERQSDSRISLSIPSLKSKFCR